MSGLPEPRRFLQLPSIDTWDNGTRHWSWRTTGCSCCSTEVFESNGEGGLDNPNVVRDGDIVRAIACLQAMHQVIDNRIMELTRELKG